MKKLTTAIGAVVLLSGGMMLPTLAQHAGRTVTTQTLTESVDFVRAGNHVLNRSHVAYVARHGNQSTVYFVGNVPPLTLADNGDSLVAQLVLANDPNLPSIPNQGRSPFEVAAPEHGRRSTIRVLPSPGTPQPVNPPQQEPTPILPSPEKPGLAIPAPREPVPQSNPEPIALPPSPGR